MSLITERPQGIPTTNSLDGVPDDLLGPVPAVIRMSGKDLTTMDNPPEMGEFVKMEITMRCKDDGRTLLADGGIGHWRAMAFVSAKVLTGPYKPAEDEVAPEPGLFDEAGNPDGDLDREGEDEE